jgi:acyl dehydratase
VTGSTSTRSLAITEELVRAYSRRGNYHSEAGTAAELGLPGLVAQGLQVAGPAYAELLDAWGGDFLAHGEVEMKFVGVVLAGQSVTAQVEFDVDAAAATFEVRNDATGQTAVVGAARCRDA